MPVSTFEPKDPLQVWDFKALPKRGSQEGLNINGGGGKTSEIKIRLRPHNNESSFFPYEHLLGTMLHELVHNVQGPHNAVFYKLLDEITEECEGFMAKGIIGSGAGFEAPSMGRLGGRGPVPIHNPPAHQLKSAALKAAEARSKKQSLMSAGPRKLGGDLSLLRTLTPAQAAARAAERRARDNIWCPCGDHGTGIGYTNDDGGVIILDNAKQSDQRGSGPYKSSQPSDAITHATMPCSTAASSSANASSRDAYRSSADNNNMSLLDSTQQQRMHQGDRAAGSLVSPGSHDKQEHLLRPKVQAYNVKGSVASTAARWEPGSSGGDLVDLTLDDSDVLPAHQPKSKRLRHHQHGTSHLSQEVTKSTSEHLSALDHVACASQQWPCSVCTLLNQDLSLQCCACGTVRTASLQCSQLTNGHSLNQPQPVSKVSSCNGNAWSCKFCSLANAAASSHCMACTQWRYSYGAPHASRPTM